MVTYLDDEDSFDGEDSGFLDEEDDGFEKEYERIFSTDTTVDKDMQEYERKGVKSRQKPKLASLNKTKLSKRELDDLFLD